MKMCAFFVQVSKDNIIWFDLILFYYHNSMKQLDPLIVQNMTTSGENTMIPLLWAYMITAHVSKHK